MSRVPWDWAVALLVLASAELGLRALEAARRLPTSPEWTNLQRVRGFGERKAGLAHAEIVLLGSSMMARLPEAELARAADPTGRSDVASVAFPGANTAVAAWIAERIVVRDLDPGLVVYGLDTQSVNEHGLRRREQGLLIGNLEAMTDDPLRWRLAWWSHDHLALYREQFLLRDWIVHPWRLPLVTPRPASAPRPPGSWTTRDSPYMWEAEAEHEFGAQAEREIRAVVAILRARSIAVVFANLPIPAEYVDYWKGDATVYARYLAKLVRLAAELTVPLVDLHDGSYGKAEFADSHHLAPDGAARAARALGEALRIRQLVPPPR